MLGRTGNITAIQSLKDGVTADFRVTGSNVKTILSPRHESKFIRPSPALGVLHVHLQSGALIRESALPVPVRGKSARSISLRSALAAEGHWLAVVDVGMARPEIAIILLNGAGSRDPSVNWKKDCSG